MCNESSARNQHCQYPHKKLKSQSIEAINLGSSHHIKSHATLKPIELSIWNRLNKRRNNVIVHIFLLLSYRKSARFASKNVLLGDNKQLRCFVVSRFWNISPPERQLQVKLGAAAIACKRKSLYERFLQNKMRLLDHLLTSAQLNELIRCLI